MSKKLTTEDFIRRAKQVHGHRYDYSKSIYTGRHSELTIVCKEHGIFNQLAGNHLRGANCPKCSGVYRRNNSDFIKESLFIHKGKYSYEKTKYKNRKDKVIITCDVHGDFQQSPGEHLSGKGCKKCALSINGKNHRLKHDDFINKCKDVHNNFYSYEKTKYVRGDLFVTITCPKHGDFQQKARNHLSGKGCLKCVSNKIIEKQSFSTMDFINRSKSIHGDFYSYNKSIYKGANKILIITCPIHGDFKQKADSHSRLGCGCPKCKRSRGEKRISDLLNLFNVNFIEQAQLGCKIKREMPFDFYLPDSKTLIEFQGEQHIIPVKHFGRVKSLRKTKFRDIVKKLWAEKNGYKLLTFSYQDKSNLELKVMNKLKLNPQLSLWK